MFVKYITDLMIKGWIHQMKNPDSESQYIYIVYSLEKEKQKKKS